MSKPNWYVVAYCCENAMMGMRIVAGPLTNKDAIEETQLRIRRKAEFTGLKKAVSFSIVEFDPFFGMDELVGHDNR